MRIHVIYDVKGWCYWNVSQALLKHAPKSIQITTSNKLPPNLSDYDIVLVTPYGRAPKYYYTCKQYGVTLITSINIGLPRRLEVVELAYQNSDFMIFNNLSSYKQWGAVENTTCIPNGVDFDIFYNEKRPRRNVALWCSSTFHQELKGYNIIKDLEKVETLVVDSHGIKKSRQEMREWYNSAKVFLILSESEGTPNPGLESAACGCVPVSTRVGNMPELIVHGTNGYFCERNLTSALHFINLAIKNYDELSSNMAKTIQDWDWRLQAQEYYRYFLKCRNDKLS